MFDDDDVVKCSSTSKTISCSDALQLMLLCMDKMDANEVHIRLRIKEPLKVRDKVFYSAFDYELSEKDLEKAARELGESDEKKEKCLRKLTKKLSKESNFTYRRDDKYWVRFLRVRKYDVEKAYLNVMAFFEQRRKYKNDYGIVPPAPDLKPFQELNWLTILPYTDEEGRIIFLMNFNRWNPDETTFEEMARTACNVLCIISMNPKCQINGIIAIFDLSGITLKHISELLSGGRMWASLSATQNGYPWRINKVLVLGINRLVRFLYSVIRPLLYRKIAGRFFLLSSDTNELHRYVNPVLLPKRLGGTLEEAECDITENVLNNLEYLRWERDFGFQ